MFTTGKIRNFISLIFITVINLIFVVKYAAEYLHSPNIAPAIYLILFITILTTLNSKHLTKFSEWIDRKYFFIVIILLFLSIVFIYTIPRFGSVGRLTAIEEWLGLLFNGIYPYTSYITPSAFPFFYFLISPFYFINQLGFLEVTGLLILLLLIKKYSVSNRNLIVLLFLLFVSPILYHDFAVRSELTFNVALFIILAAFLNDEVKLKGFRFLLFGVLFGLVLSTRSVMIVPMIIFLLFYFRNDFKKLFLFGAIIVVVFILQILPLVIWDANLFIEKGPFAIQSHLADLPKWFIGFCIILSIYFGWIVQNIREVFFTTGIMLFIMIITSYISKIFEFGFQLAFFGDNYIDPAYLAFVLPFLILSVEDYEIDKALGRML